MNKIKIFQRIALVVLIILAAVLLLPTLSKLTVEEILTYSPAYPLLAAMVLVALYSLKAMVCAIPMTVLYISAGIMFPPVWALIITYVGLACEIAIGYYVGRFLGGEEIMRFVEKNKKTAKYKQYLEKNTNAVVFTVRVVPGPLPFDIMSWLFGASGMGFALYMLYSLLGVSAAMLPWVLAGNTITNPFSKEFLLPFGVCLLAALVVLLLLRYIEKKKKPNNQSN